ncbi:GNAT family N-acetyltransferase [Cohnella yongneupensis]|uniref:GNAT family N-acetyltransferase n=1 Tax=Cohnella yongneupensis TaxID=425006 RepID=A0ABW0QX16_9BACL
MQPSDEQLDAFPTIETNTLRLRQITTRDAGDLYGFYSGRDFTKYLDWDGPSSIDECIGMINHWNERFQHNLLIPWGISTRYSPILIGTIMVMPMKGTFADVPRFPLTLSYDLREEYWNSGVMTEGLTAALDYTKQHLGPHRIQAEVVPENVASLKLLQKLGFQQEGLLKHYLMHEVTHKFLNIALLALLVN